MTPTRTEAGVLGTEQVGALVLVRLALAAGHEPGGPGTFHMALDPDGAAFLPRPVGVVPLADGGAGILVAPGTAAGALATARRIELLGPLGNGYDATGLGAHEVLLVGEGFGVAAFAGAPALLGGRPRLVVVGDAGLAPLVDADVEVVAPDRAAARVSAHLEAGGIRAVWIAAGRAGAAIVEAARVAGVPSRVALHAPMACGFGACYGCAVRLDGAWKRACVEGPVVDPARLEVPA